MSVRSKYSSVFFIGFLFMQCLSSQTLTLKDVLKISLENNLMLRKESLNTSIADADIITAGIRPNLKLNNQTLMVVDQPYFAPGVPWISNKNRQDWWQLTKVIQWPGQRRWKINTSVQQKKVVGFDLSETQRSMMLNVAEKYLDIWSGIKQIMILEEAKQNIDSLVIVNKNKFDQKKLSETDYLRTEILSEECAIQISETSLELKNDLRTLQQLMNVTDSVIIDTTLNITSIEFDKDSLLLDAFLQRPDFLGSQSMLDYSTSNIKLQKKLAFPRLDFGLIWNPQNTVQYVGFIATIDIPIFDRNQGEIKKSLFIKDQSEKNLIAIKSQVNTDVINAYEEFNNKKSNLLKYRTIFLKTEKILDEIRTAYSNGETDIIDFLEAQRSWIESKNYFIDLQYKYFRSYVNLLYQSGKINLLIME
jgi:cobalt-zinc-cadmium efflux system outer membrane protein